MHVADKDNMCHPSKVMTQLLGFKMNPQGQNMLGFLSFGHAALGIPFSSRFVNDSSMPSALSH